MLTCARWGAGGGRGPDLAAVPFDQLAKLKQKLGVTGTAASRERLRAAAAKSAAAAAAAGPPVFASKHRPKELPSNKPVKTLRVVVDGITRVRPPGPPLRRVVSCRVPTSRLMLGFAAWRLLTALQKGRDPRFDALSGSFNQDLYEKSYGFLDELRAKETKALEAALAKEKDLERKEQLRQSLAKRVTKEGSARGARVGSGRGGRSGPRPYAVLRWGGVAAASANKRYRPSASASRPSWCARTRSRSASWSSRARRRSISRRVRVCVRRALSHVWAIGRALTETGRPVCARPRRRRAQAKPDCAVRGPQEQGRGRHDAGEAAAASGEQGPPLHALCAACLAA